MIIVTNSGKAVAGFAVNACRPFVISYDQNKENGCLESDISVRAFKHRPVSVELQGKSTFVYIDFLYPPDNVPVCNAMLVRYQLVITFMLCCC